MGCPISTGREPTFAHRFVVPTSRIPTTSRGFDFEGSYSQSAVLGSFVCSAKHINGSDGWLFVPMRSPEARVVEAV